MSVVDRDEGRTNHVALVATDRVKFDCLAWREDVSKSWPETWLAASWLLRVQNRCVCFQLLCATVGHYALLLGLASLLRAHPAVAVLLGRLLCAVCRSLQ